MIRNALNELDHREPVRLVGRQVDHDFFDLFGKPLRSSEADQTFALVLQSAQFARVQPNSALQRS